MKKITAILLLILIIQSVPVAFAAEAEGTISITLDKATATIGDIIEATVTLENMDVCIMSLPIHFNPDVVKIADNNGAVAASGLKTAVDLRNGKAGVIPGQAISGELNAEDDPLYWNGAIFENPQYPYLNNNGGLYKLMFSNTKSKLIINETLITLRFAVVGAGNSDIRFATKADREYDETSPDGVEYYGDAEAPRFPEIKSASITTQAGGTPPPIQPPSGGSQGGGFSPTVTVNPESESDTLIYEVPEKVIDNSLARAFAESNNGLNIEVNAGSNVKTFIIKVPVPSVRKAQEALVFSFMFDTPIGLIGFKNSHILTQTDDDSKFVILTIKGNLDCSISIDEKNIQGCLLGFHEGNIGAVAFTSNNPAMKSRFDGENLILLAETNGNYIVQTKALTFADIDSSHWAYGYVQSLVGKNVISGIDENTFSPESNVTREQFAKMTVEALGLYDSTASCDFSDLDENHWAYTYVASAVQAGIIKGYDDGTFGVGRNITREEMAVIMYRLDIEFAVSVLPTAFTDKDDIADWAADAVTRMQMANIIAGFEDGSFKPLENATRAQAAKIIFGVLAMF